jgi:hypothetical protein
MKPHPYLILVDGGLRASDRAWLADLIIHPSVGNRTELSGNLDQSGLLGVLRRLQHLALEVFEVHRMCGCVGSRHATVAVPQSAN